MAWHSFFTFSLGDHVISKRTHPAPHEPTTFLVPGNRIPNPTLVPHRSNRLLDLKKEDLGKRITTLDKTATNTPLIAALLIALLNMNEVIDEDNKTLSKIVSYLSIVVLATATVIAVLAKNKSVDLIIERERLEENSDEEEVQEEEVDLAEEEEEDDDDEINDSLHGSSLA